MNLWIDFGKTVTLLLVLLNPFLMSIYLLDLFQSLDHRTFIRVFARGSIIATGIFCLFAVFGDAIFSDFLQVRFASFLVFGGLLFVIIGLRFAQLGPAALVQLRGQPEHLAGAIAMPFMVGPGTISASVLAGARLPITWAVVAIFTAMAATVVGIALVKWLHGLVRARNARLVDRYVEVIGRASALLVGTVAIDMILNGLDLWLTTRGG